MRFVFAPFELDEATLALRRDGYEVPIGPQALSLLLHLVRNRSRVVSRQELHDLLWKGTVVGETSLGQAVRHARRALGDGGAVQHFIRSVRGHGYRFGAPVRVESGPFAVPEDGVRVAAVATPSGDGFFGRRSELEVFDAAFAPAQGGRGDALWITGEEGVGKTRLLSEVAKRAAASGARVLQAGCIPSAWASPYGPFAELIGRVRRLEVGDSRWNELGEDALLLERLAGKQDAAAVPAEPVPPREEDRLRVFLAISRLFEALAAHGTLVILLDDLHRADSATLALTHHVARHARSSGWLLVGALRDGLHPGAGDPRIVSLLQVGERRAPVALGGLSRQDIGRLLESLAGRLLPRELIEDIHRETGGNPFFAREIFRNLLEEGALIDEVGDWVDSLRLEDASPPDGVSRVVSRRLAALGPSARELLATASAARGTFHFEVVRRAAQLDEDEALDALDEALDAHLLERTPEALLYAFAHDLTRRVLYFEQSPARRVRLHRRLAESLVAVHGVRAGAHAERIARHYHASAGLPGAEVGIAHCLLAADRAAAVAAWEDEASYVAMALDLLPPEDLRRSRLLERQGLALAFSGSASEAARVASDAAAWIEAHKGRAAASEYLVNVVTGVAWSASKLAWDLSDQAERLLDRNDLLAAARLRLVTLWRDASLGEAPLDSPAQRTATLTALDNWHALDPPRKNALALVGLAFESRQEVLERAGDTAVFLALWAGEYERAIALFRENVQPARTPAEVAATYFYECAMARLQAALGRIDEARSGFARSERLLAGLPSSAHFAVMRASTRTEIAHAAGEGFEALAPVFEDLALSADDAARWMMPTVLCVGAEVFALAGRGEESLRMLEAALPGMVRSPGWMMTFGLMVNAAVGTLWALDRDDWLGLLEKQLREKTLAPDFRFPSTDARLSMARLCALQERYEEAEAWFREAGEVLDEQGARPLRAIADLDQARMLLRRGETGDEARAALLLRSCNQAFRSVGMPGWIERARALSDGHGTRA